jgi:cellobiose phosphorylase
MYRLLVESLLGLTRTATTLTLEPRLPQTWSGFSLAYRYQNTSYQIRVSRSGSAAPQLTVDGVQRPDMAIELSDSGGVRKVELLLPQTGLNP